MASLETATLYTKRESAHRHEDTQKALPLLDGCRRMELGQQMEQTTRNAYAAPWNVAKWTHDIEKGGWKGDGQLVMKAKVEQKGKKGAGVPSRSTTSAAHSGPRWETTAAAAHFAQSVQTALVAKVDRPQSSESVTVIVSDALVRSIAADPTPGKKQAIQTKDSKYMRAPYFAWQFSQVPWGEWHGKKGVQKK